MPRQEASRGKAPGRSARPWPVGIAVGIAIIKPLTLLLTRARWRGTTRVPERGGVILAVNHVSLADPAVLCDFVIFGCGRVPAFLAKAPLFSMFFVGWVLRAAHQIPVYRERAEGGGALDTAVRRLRDGACVVIYPEGTVTRDPHRWPMRARTGVARLALDSGAPVLPVGQWGAARIGPLRRVRCDVVAGAPVDLSAWRGLPLSADVLREATDVVMRDVTALVAGLRGEEPPARPFDPRARQPAA